MRELSLFTGAGGGLLASKMLGWETKGYVEIDGYCQRVLRSRMEDGLIDEAPIFSDIRAFIREGYAASYQGMVDVISAGFPCQAFSEAGRRKAGRDNRNLWPETIATIRIIRPPLCFLENVPGLFSARNTICNDCGHTRIHWDDERETKLCSACGAEVVETPENTFWYFGTILRDLAESGYNARWRVLSAAELGAPHWRKRIWIVAYSQRERWDGWPWAQWETWRYESQDSSSVLANTAETRLEGTEQKENQYIAVGQGFEQQGGRASESAMGRMAHGMAHWVDSVGTAAVSGINSGLVGAGAGDPACCTLSAAQGRKIESAGQWAGTPCCSGSMDTIK